MDLHLVSMISSEQCVLDAEGFLLDATFVSIEDASCSSGAVRLTRN